MKVKFFIFVSLFLFLLIGFMSFSSASFEIGNTSYFIQENYKPGQEINAWLNISFDSEPVSSLFSDSFGNSNSLEAVLNNSRNSGYVYSCDSLGCVADYSEVNEAFTSKSFQLSADDEMVVGVKFNGIIDQITNTEFEIVSNAGKACEGQLEIDLGDDGVIDYGNNKLSTESCESRETQSCYDESESPREVPLNYNPYCQKFDLESAPGFSVGLWIKKVVSGDKKVYLELYDTYQIKQESCNLNLAQITNAGSYVYCDVNYFAPEKGEYYLCAYSGNTGTGDYNTKGYYSSNSSKVCGFWDYPSSSEGMTNAYALSIKPKKFNDFGTLKVNESVVYGGLSGFIEDKIIERYSSFDCSSGCYFPIRIKSNVAQNVTFKNLQVSYDEMGLPGATETNFYELEKKGYKISSDFQKLYLSGLYVSETINEDYKLFFNGQEVLKENISLKDFGISLELVNYEKVVEGFENKFYVDAYLESNISNYRMIVDGREIESRYPNLYYIFNESGNKTIIIEVETKQGEIFSETKDIKVYPIEQGFGELLDEKKTKLTEIENELIKLSPEIEQKIVADINFEQLRASLNQVEDSYMVAQTKEDYIELIPLLESIEFPFEIKTSSSINNLYLIEKESVEVNALKEPPKEYDSAQDVVDYIIYWNVQNLNVQYNYEDVSVVNDLEYEISSFRKINLNVEERGPVKEKYYLYVDSNSGLEIIGQQIEEKNGYYVMELDNFQTVEILSESTKPLEQLPVFISPEVKDLEFSFGEVEEYDKSKNTLVLILLLFILILGGLVAYYFIGKWYDEKYERKLFPNRNDIFNLINYIARSKKNGVPESKIRKNLLNSKWSSEQVRFILRKYLGKNTGMYAFFKRKVKIERKIAREEERKIAKERMQKKVSRGKPGKIKERSVVLLVILSIITVGIYYFIWFLLSSKELKKINKNAPSSLLAGSVLISICLVIILFIISMLVSNLNTVSTLGTLAMIILIIGSILYIISIFKYSQAHSEVTGFSKGGMFALLFFLSWIGGAIAQDKLNNVAKKLQKT
jgi:hypothetical protein